MLQLVEFRPTMLPQLTELVNRHICQIPPNWSLTELQVAYTLSHAGGLWSAHYSDDGATQKVETVCVIEDNRLAAAAQWGLPANERELQIYWIVADPEQTRALRLLLAGITRQAKMRGYSDIVLYRYAFGVGWYGMPQMWTHLIFGLEESGFEAVEKWVMMTTETNLPSRRIPPDPEQQIRLDWRANDGALEWKVEAFDGMTRIGTCEAWGIPPHLAGSQDADKWVTIEWVGVEKLYRRKGMGQVLLNEQLRHQTWRGVKNAILWTETSNAAARKLNEAMGFQYGPECWVFKKFITP
jgi:GNAT superfamily N-acetyltransferase